MASRKFGQADPPIRVGRPGALRADLRKVQGRQVHAVAVTTVCHDAVSGEMCPHISVYFASTHAACMYIGTRTCARVHATCRQSIETTPSPRYSRWKIKSEREGSPWRIPRTPNINVEHPGEVCRMEEINQSVAMGARPLPTINIVRRGAGARHMGVSAL